MKTLPVLDRAEGPTIPTFGAPTLASAVNRINDATNDGRPLYAYAPAGFGLARLVEHAVVTSGRTPIFVNEAIGEALHTIDLAQKTPIVLVVDDRAAPVDSNAARLFSKALNGAPVIVLGHRSRPSWEADRSASVLRPVDLLADQAPASTGGWPALVDIHRTSAPDNRASELTAHLRRRWWPHVSSNQIRALSTLVAAERTWADRERSMLPGLDGAVLDELLDLRVLLQDADSRTLTLVPAVAQVVGESVPREVDEARTGVARVRERLGTGDAGLANAARRRDWEACSRIMERWWPELVFGGYRELVQRVTLQAPEAALRRHVGLGVRAEYLGRLPLGTVPLTSIRPRSTSGPAVSDVRAVIALRTSITAMIGRRVRGRLKEGHRLALDLEGFADACRAADLGPTVAATPLWYLQAGLTCHLAGDTVAAERLYRKGWQLRERADLDFVPRDLALKIALLRAAAGLPADARWWLERAAEQPDASGAASAYTSITERAVGLLVGLDEADLVGFDQILTELGDAYVRDETWPFVVAAVVGRRLAGSDVNGALRSLATVRDLYPATSSAGGLHTIATGLLTAEASLAAGHVLQARTEADSLPAVGAVQAFKAVLALVSGDPDEALHLTATADRATCTDRDRLRLDLVEAVAYRRRGDTRRAAVGLEAAALVAHRTGAPMALAGVPREDLLDLAHDAPTAGLLLRQLDAAGVRSLVPASVELVKLSDREQAVLEALARHGSNDGIARALFVSVNTVKTQLRSVYAKLGVNSRRDAIRAAREHGLLGGVAVHHRGTDL